jgi:hypothetical protein
MTFAVSGLFISSIPAINTTEFEVFEPRYNNKVPAST